MTIQENNPSGPSTGLKDVVWMLLLVAACIGFAVAVEYGIESLL